MFELVKLNHASQQIELNLEKGNKMPCVLHMCLESTMCHAGMSGTTWWRRITTDSFWSGSLERIVQKNRFAQPNQYFLRVCVYALNTQEIASGTTTVPLWGTQRFVLKECHEEMVIPKSTKKLRSYTLHVVPFKLCCTTSNTVMQKHPILMQNRL